MDKIYPDTLIYREAIAEGGRLAKVKELPKESEITRRVIEWLEYSKKAVK